MVVTPQEPDGVPSNITTPPPVITKGQSNRKYRSNLVFSLTKKTTRHQLTAQGIKALQTEGKLNELGQRISAIEKAQLQKKKILKEQFTE
ncbi:unnamed protein product, partial [Coregonus sp. 'balchen']